MGTLISETRGQLLFEWNHLLSKLRKRSPEKYDRIHLIAEPEPHPIFDIIDGRSKGLGEG